MVLEKSGNLLESGLFDGNYYGTPKPPHEPPVENLKPPGSQDARRQDFEPNSAYPGMPLKYGIA